MGRKAKYFRLSNPEEIARKASSLMKELYDHAIEDKGYISVNEHKQLCSYLKIILDARKASEASQYDDIIEDLKVLMGGDEKFNEYLERLKELRK